jgi:PPM family protein phosphatase
MLAPGPPATYVFLSRRPAPSLTGEDTDLSDQPRLATESIAGLRPYQEDSVHADNLSDGRLLVAVADGMGGHAAGEVASAMALEVLVESLEAGEALDEAFRLANARVHEAAREPGKQGMGTTLVAALVDGDEYLVANVGDSRIYLMTGDGIRQLSEDHSFVAEAMKRGQSEEEATSSQWKDALTRSIGTDEEVEVDTFGPFPVEENTALFLCSDGLYKVMKHDRIRALFGQSGGPRGAAQSLVSTAYEDGSDDNITVAIAEFGEVPRDRAMGTMPIEFDPPPAEAEEVEETVVEETPAAAPVQATGSGMPMGLIAVVVLVLAVAAYFVLGR